MTELTPDQDKYLAQIKTGRVIPFPGTKKSHDDLVAIVRFLTQTEPPIDHAAEQETAEQTRVNRTQQENLDRQTQLSRALQSRPQSLQSGPDGLKA